MTNGQNLEDGFRRILYDAMTLSSSVRIVRGCVGYPLPASTEIDGNVEANHLNAMIQLRSMEQFLTAHDDRHSDTMLITHFLPSCRPHNPRLPVRHDPHWKAFDKYAAHKSWQAVAKDATQGAAQIHKRQLVELALVMFGGFDDFRDTCRRNGIGVALNDYGRAYESIYDANVAHLRSAGA